MLYHMWVNHHLRPGEFWKLPRGERSLLFAFMEEELSAYEKQK